MDLTNGISSAPQKLELLTKIKAGIEARVNIEAHVITDALRICPAGLMSMLGSSHHGVPKSSGAFTHCLASFDLKVRRIPFNCFELQFGSKMLTAYWVGCGCLAKLNLDPNIFSNLIEQQGAIPDRGSWPSLEQQLQP